MLEVQNPGRTCIFFTVCDLIIAHGAEYVQTDEKFRVKFLHLQNGISGRLEVSKK